MKNNSEAKQFFSQFDYECDKLFCKFLDIDRKHQEEIFKAVRKEYERNTPESLEKNECWRSLDDMINSLHHSAVEGCLSNSGHWLMTLFGTRAKEFDYEKEQPKINNPFQRFCNLEF